MSRDPVWDEMKAASRAKFDADRARFMAEAIEFDDGKWTKHSEYHWSRMLAGKKLDFWPSRKKFQYDGQVRRGNVRQFIASKEDE